MLAEPFRQETTQRTQESFFHRLDDVFVGSVAPRENRDRVETLYLHHSLILDSIELNDITDQNIKARCSTY